MRERCYLPLVLLLPLLAGAAHAQDEQRVVSPDGQLQFRLFPAVPAGSSMNCLAYQVWWHGKALLDTSFLGLNIHFQEPLLGENVGFSSAKPEQGAHYHGMLADYPQNSTTGRRMELETRVWNDGVAFRYIVPPSALLMNLLIEDDATEFRFAHDAAAPRPEKAALPYVEQEPGIGWLGIYESPSADFPRMTLTRNDAHTLDAHLPQKPHDPGVAYDGTTPWTSPWRIIVIAPDRDGLARAEILQELGK